MRAAARIVKPGGLVILACECSDGTPLGSPYERVLHSVNSPDELLVRLARPGFAQPEQWQAQVQALIQKKARVQVYSNLPDPVVQACHLTPCRNIEKAVDDELSTLTKDASIAVLPFGPLTVPYMEV